MIDATPLHASVGARLCDLSLFSLSLYRSNRHASFAQSPLVVAELQATSAKQTTCSGAPLKAKICFDATLQRMQSQIFSS